MITYQTFLKNHPNPIKDVSDETVEKGLEDWFKYRYIGFENENKFLDILRRNVAINYPMYEQKLRIEPGVSEYDWLVQTYRERQLKTNGSSENTRIHGDDTSTRTATTSEDGTTAYGKTATTTHTGTDTGTHTGTDTRNDAANDTANHTGTVGSTHTGTDTRNDTANDIAGHTGTVESTHTGKEQSEGRTKNSSTKTGSYTENSVEGLHTTETSPHVTVRNQNGGDRSEWGGAQQVQATTPMSKKYDKSDMIEPSETDNDPQFYKKAYQHMPALDWQNLTAQSQSGNRGYVSDNTYTETKYIYGDDKKGDIQTREGSTKSPDRREVTYDNDKTVGDGQNHSAITKDLADNEARNLKDITDHTGKSTITKDLADDETRNLKDITDHTGKSTTIYDTTNKTEYDTQAKTIDGGTDTNSRSGQSNERSENVYGNIIDNGSHSQTDREQVTGRNEDPAVILERATRFIEHSSAFMWFKEQLDSCFFPGYYTDRSNDEEEGSCCIW